jgi:hypothetical protein
MRLFDLANCILLVNVDTVDVLLSGRLMVGLRSMTATVSVRVMPGVAECPPNTKTHFNCLSAIFSLAPYTFSFILYI